MAFKKILVPVDFSEYSHRAIQYALLLAGKFQAHITILHVVELFEEDVNEEEYLENYEKVIEQKERNQAKKLQLQVKEGKKKQDNVDSILLRGINATGAILSLIEENNGFDLIIMGSHGHTGFKRWVFGSDTEKVVRFSPVPVITIHKKWQELKIDKIVVPVDFSKYSEIAIEKAKQIASEFNSRLQFIHVVQEEAHPEFYTISFEPILKANPQLKSHITKNLIKLTSLKEDQADFIVLEGKVSQEIKKYATRNKTDLIIMPTYGMSEMEHLFLGSNTEKVVRIAPCPVLTVRK